MSRASLSSLINALTQKECSPFYAIEAFFDSGTVRFWTGYGERAIGGETYIGTGNLMSFGEFEETGDLSAAGYTITLNGIPSEMVSLALNEPYQQRICNVYMGETSVSETADLGPAIMNVMSFTDDGTVGTIKLELESEMLLLERDRTGRYTHEDQQSRLAPGQTDSFFSFVTDLADKEILWGRT